MVTDFTPGERAGLWAVAALGFLGLNGVFGFAVLFRPQMLTAAMTNPLAVVFVVEALALTGVLAYLLQRWQVTRLHWTWFVALALAGSLAFAVPLAALWKKSPAGSRQ
jgi:hypothetical protein